MPVLIILNKFIQENNINKKNNKNDPNQDDNQNNNDENDEIIHRNESALEMVKINNIPSALRKGVFDVNGDGNREK